jgi:tetratricopeptide (TPR) repeat protein
VEHRFAAHAGASLILALVALAAPAAAAPSRSDAKALFDKALAAYSAKDFAGAVDLLGKSFALEADADTLFAWAQAERKLGRCDKAITLYDKLLALDLAKENREAVTASRAECKQIVDAAKAKEPAPEPTPTVAERLDAKPQAVDRDTPLPTKQRSAEGGRAWWRDPLGDTFVLLGLGGGGVGAVLMVKSSAANHDKLSATSYGDFRTDQNRATSLAIGGEIAIAGGAALVVAGIVRYATHRQHRERSIAMTGWFVPSSSGLAIAGSF